MGSLVRLLRFEGGNAHLVEVTLAEDSPAAGVPIADLGVPRDAPWWPWCAATTSSCPAATPDWPSATKCWSWSPPMPRTTVQWSWSVSPTYGCWWR